MSQPTVSPTPTARRYVMHLAKEDFKFSAAHFTLFPDGHAELLHGHNYRVRVEIAGPRLDGEGLLVDIAEVKAWIRAACERLDERTLIPSGSDRLEVVRGVDGEAAEPGVEVRFGDRLYRLPEADVVFLPLINVSIELLAEHFWNDLAPRLEALDAPLDHLTVEVGETAGQSCSYGAPLAPAS